MQNDGRYRAVLKESVAVWTFTSQHTEHLIEIGINKERIFTIPLYTDFRYLEATYSLYHALSQQTMIESLNR